MLYVKNVIICYTEMVKVFLRNPAGMYFFKINNTSTRTMRKICSKLTIKTLERRQRLHERSQIIDHRIKSFTVQIFYVDSLSLALQLHHDTFCTL